jgi:hypothetical protein
MDQHGSTAAGQCTETALPRLAQATHGQVPAKHGTAQPGPPAESDVVFITRSKRKLTGWKAETFGRFWDAFDFKYGRAEAADAWLNIADLTAELADRIITAAVYEARARPGLLADGGKPKWAQGWLSGRRWEDEGLAEDSGQGKRPETWAERKAREMAEKGTV